MCFTQNEFILFFQNRFIQGNEHFNYGKTSAKMSLTVFNKGIKGILAKFFRFRNEVIVLQCIGHQANVNRKSVFLPARNIGLLF